MVILHLRTILGLQNFLKIKCPRQLEIYNKVFQKYPKSLLNLEFIISFSFDGKLNLYCRKNVSKVLSNIRLQAKICT